MRTSTSEGKHLITPSQLPAAVDRETFRAVMANPPTAADFPNTYAWFVLINKFLPAIQDSWTGPAAKGAEKKPAEKKVEAPKVEAKADDDDMDLFGDEDDEVLLNTNYLLGSPEGPRRAEEEGRRQAQEGGPHRQVPHSLGSQALRGRDQP